MSSSVFVNPVTYRRILVGVTVAYFVAFIPFINMRISSHHGWRQSQTADTARILARTGFDVLHPRLSVFGPKATLAYEFPWYQTLAAVLSKLGVPLIISLRGVAMLFTAATALGVAAITRRLAGERPAILGAILYLFNPMTFAWGRAPLIESFTTAAALAWVLGAWRAKEELNRTIPTASPWTGVGMFAVPMLAGSICATSKFTTAAPWALVVLAVLFEPRIQTAFTTALVVGVPMTVGVAWTSWADHLKNQSVLSQMESSAAVRRHLIRPLSDRAQFLPWATIGRNVLLFIGLIGIVWLLLGAAALLSNEGRLISAAVLLVPFIAPLIFFGLYQVHDYYLVAVTPAISILLGVGADQMPTLFNRRLGTLFGFMCVHIIGFLIIGGWGFLNTQMPRGYTATTELATTTTSAEQVLGVAQAWNPHQFFEADRQGYLIGIGPKPAALIPLLRSDLGNPTALWTQRPKSSLVADFLQHFPRVAAVGRETYRFGASEADLTSGPVQPATTWERSGLSRSSQSRVTSKAEIATVPCTGEVQLLPRQVSAFVLTVDTQIWLSQSPESQSPESQSSGSAPLPVFSGTVRSAKPMRTLSCLSVNGTKTSASIQILN